MIFVPSFLFFMRINCLLLCFVHCSCFNSMKKVSFLFVATFSCIEAQPADVNERVATVDEREAYIDEQVAASVDRAVQAKSKQRVAAVFEPVAVMVERVAAVNQRVAAVFVPVAAVVGRVASGRACGKLSSEWQPCSSQRQ